MPDDRPDNPLARMVETGRRHGGRLFVALLVVCAGLAAADLAYHKHVHYAAEGWFAAYAVFGFLACLGIVLAARMLRGVTGRRDSYYGDRGHEAERGAPPTHGGRADAEDRAAR